MFWFNDKDFYRHHNAKVYKGKITFWSDDKVQERHYIKTLKKKEKGPTKPELNPNPTPLVKLTLSQPRHQKKKKKKKSLLVPHTLISL